jgi:DNA-binding beta-propeller fold protein YncE
MPIIRRRTLVLLCVLALSLSLSPSRNAGATVNNNFCHFGSAAGQCKEPEGLAVDLETNRVYVADTANNRIDVFKTSGEFLFAFGWGVDTGTAKLETCSTASSCQAGIAGSGAGQLNSPNYVAVDNAAGSLSEHNVYVGEKSNRRVQEFDPEGKFLLSFGKNVNTGTSGKPNLCTNAGPPTDVCGSGQEGSGLGEFNRIRGVGITGTGTVYVIDDRDVGQCEGLPGNGQEEERRLEKFKGSGEPIEAKVVTESPVCNPVGAFAVDSAGNFYAFVERDPRTIRKYDPNATLLKKIDEGRTPDALAVDAGGNLFAAQSEIKVQALGSYAVLSKYDGTSGEPLRRFAHGEIEESVLGLAVSASGHVFASERFSAADPRILDLTEPPPGPIVPPPSLKAIPGATLATLKAEINAEGKATSYHFEYLTQKAFEEASESFATATKTETLPLNTNELQRLHIDASAGQFKLSFGSGGPGISETADLPFNATAAQIQSALNALTNVSSGGGAVTVKAGSEAATYLVSFDGGPLANTDVSQLKYLNGTTPLSGGGATVQITTLNQGGLFNLHGVEAQIGCANPATEFGEGKCLIPETTYRFKIVAENADGKGNTPLEGTFLTEESPKFLALWSTEVGPDSASLNAELNPFGLPTSGVFEYVEDAKYQVNGFTEASKAPSSGSINFGEGEAPVKGEVSVFPLQPGTTYHYRLAATNLLHTGLSKEATFRTFDQPLIAACENDPFRYGLGAFLPDCRGYEMVSPLEKEGADIMPGNTHLHVVRAALDVSSVSGDKLTYGTLRAFADAEAAPYISQYLASRDPVEGWQTHSLAGPRTTLILNATSEVARDSEFKVFSPDLCEGWLLRVSEPLLDPAGIAGYPNLMRRVDEECEGSGEASYEAITRGKPLDLLPEGSGSLVLEGLSEDGAVAIYDWRDNLEGATPVPSPQPVLCTSSGNQAFCNTRLYEQKQGGPLEFICVLPNGEPSSSPCQAGTLNGAENSRDASVNNALSADGSRVFWTASGVGEGPIYVRIGGTETVAVSKAAEEEAGSGGSQFWAAAEDGSKAIFTSGGRLYEFAVDTKTKTLVSKGVKGVAGVSEDANKTYFASTEAIAGSGQNSEGDEAIAGEPNLYLREAGVGGGISFIATVTSNDVSPPPGTNNVTLAAGSPVFRGSRVSADGVHLAFMSAGSPTGYDNTDAKSGEADTEVYLYDAESDQLICVSCNPSGARPAGELDKYARRKQWVGGKIPTWSNILFAPRVLSEGGQRLFFESPDALVARDTNGLSDIYEWEAPGAGGCTEATYTYSALNQGCLDLISSGKSARKAEFVDASPSGTDVFFSYQQSLVGQDSDKLVDIYDARVGGGFAPPPPPPPICEAEACQHPAEAPQFQSPSSRQYEGPGNVAEKAKRKRCRKGTHKVRTKAGKVRCVKNKHRKHHQSRRAAR